MSKNNFKKIDIYSEMNRYNDIDRRLVNFSVNLVSKILHIYVKQK